MKRILIILPLFLISLIGKAQTEKGRFTVGAQLANITYQDQNGGKDLSGNFSPSAGYFVANGLVIGAGIPFSIANGRSTYNNAYYQYKNNSFAVGLSPFIRYFIGKNKLKPYLSIAYSYSRLTSNGARNDQTGSSVYDGKGKATSLIPTIGLAYFVNQNLGLIVGLNYNVNHQNQDVNYVYNGNTSSTYVNDSDSKLLSLGIGFQLFIGR